MVSHSYHGDDIVGVAGVDARAVDTAAFDDGTSGESGECFVGFAR
jgi:hypothetical protein